MPCTSIHQLREFELQENNHEKLDLLTVQVKNAFKCYGSKKHPVNVLNGLNISVRKNSIYGLLGPSGCGKTTILSCIVGLKQLNSGEIKVFGHEPRSKGSGIPGPRIGYMPQELALFKKFTIRETVKYFGLIIGVEDLKAKQESFSKLLKLPDQDSQIEKLSVGQQRRVSLMIALFHEPELLILDEPTVGFDPLLREEIRRHLTSLVEGGKTTIVITTHYIEEARLAQTVGLMRGGQLLVEESPDKLIAQHQVETLEDVFINLCNDQNPVQIRQRQEIKLDDSVPPEVKSTRPLQALIWKNFLWLSRNLGFLTFIIIFPIVQLGCLYFGYGHDPKVLTLSLVNFELGDGEICDKALNCDGNRLSCNYTDRMKEFNVIWVMFENEREAIQKIDQSKFNGAVVVHNNFSDGIKRRFRDGIRRSNLPSSTIDVHLDLSNDVLSKFLKKKLFETFEDFLKDYLNSCNISVKEATVPIKFNDPMYGTKYTDLNNYAMPGLLLHAVYSIGVSLTGGILLDEKKEGLINGTFALGVNYFHVIAGHLITQLTIIVTQIAVILILSSTVFKIEMNGDLMPIVAIFVLTGFGGMSFGCFLACCLDNELISNYAVMGVVFPMMCVSDIIWPIQSMPVAMQVMVNMLPLTQSVQALRNINTKGFNFYCHGFLFTLLWIGLFLVLCVVVLRIKNK